MPCAEGNTGWPVWAPGGTHFAYALNCTNAVLNPAVSDLNRFNVFGGILWNQGEHSVMNGITDHNTQFLAMIAGFRSAIIGMQNVTPIVICNMASNGLEAYTVYTKHQFNQDVATLAAVTTYNDTFGLRYMDAFHYTPASMRQIGRLYFDAYVKAAQLASSKPDSEASILIHPRPGHEQSKNKHFPIGRSHHSI